ncbi:MAG: ABC transporter permease [Stellaceae bacterium]
MSTRQEIGTAAPRRPVRVIRSDGAGVVVSDDDNSLFAPFTLAWRRRHLLRRLARRDVEQRFRGSVLGKVWLVVGPLFMLTLYTIAFGLLLKPKWQESVSSPAEIAMIYFSGLIVFDFFMECVNRAPNLMFEHITYIKKMVFPLEILAWVAVGSALARLLVGSVLLSIMYVALRGLPPLAVLAVPLLMVMLGIVALGFVWLLTSIAVFVRDIRHLLAVLMPIFMFLTPVFFPLSSAPKFAQVLLYANPLTFILEGVRAALFEGAWPNWFGVIAYIAGAVLFAWAAFRLFRRLREGFADVL